MNLSDYINYWDKKIVALLAYRSSSYIYPTSFGIGEPPLQGDFIPEPFMGNPDEFSFVIVNLNPGAGVPHSWLHCQDIPGTLVNKVKKIGYSNAVCDFPYLQDENTVGLIDWNNSPGRVWWKEKESWIKHKIKLFEPSYKIEEPIPNNLLPFAMEMYAWHTCEWPKILENKMNAKNKKYGKKYGTDVKDKVIDPLYDAIKKSRFHIAFCVGKPIGEIIASFCLFKKTNSTPIKPISTIERYYDVYEDGKGNRIINTWAQGGNKFPSGDFETAEASII